jgi:hypothetical protein
MVTLALAAWLAFAAAGCAQPNHCSFGIGVTPASQPASAPAATRFVLNENVEVWFPGELQAARQPVPLLVHFHGGMDTLQREVQKAGVHGVAVAVNYRGLSAAYERPFSQPGAFSKLLEDVRQALRERGLLAGEVEFGEVWLTSFSAGYGAVRAILATPEGFERVAGVYLADSLYAGWKDDQPYAGADPDNMTPFRRLATAAAGGEKRLLLSHSYYDPQRYAGTHVTADDLIAFIGLTRVPCDEAGPQDMRIVSRASRGWFAVWGCTAPRDEHVRHLQNMGYWLAKLVADEPAR